MSSSVVFSSLAELARFLWGEPGSDPKQSPHYQYLIEAKAAWVTQSEPGGRERLLRSLQALDQHIRQNYFYPPHDAVTILGTPRQVLAIGYQAPSVPGQTTHGVFWSLCACDVIGDADTVNQLRQQIDRSYGPGYFDKYIVSVRRISQDELVKRAHTFGPPCDMKAEVV